MVTPAVAVRRWRPYFVGADRRARGPCSPCGLRLHEVVELVCRLARRWREVFGLGNACGPCSISGRIFFSVEALLMPRDSQTSTIRKTPFIVEAGSVNNQAFERAVADALLHEVVLSVDRSPIANSWM